MMAIRGIYTSLYRWHEVDMVVDHSTGLHKSIGDGAPYEFKAPFFQILTHAVTYLSSRRNLAH